MKQRTHLIGLGLVIILLASLVLSAGCSKKASPTDLASLQEAAAKVNAYSFSYERSMNDKQTTGKFYYNDGNVRFEVNGADSSDQTVTICNKADNQSYIYSTKLKKGEMVANAAFLQDVPLVSEIMTGMTKDNSKWVRTDKFDEKDCTVFTVNNLSLAGGAFNGEVWINQDTAMPIMLVGYRGNRTVTYMYKSFSMDKPADSLFAKPADVEFTQKK